MERYLEEHIRRDMAKKIIILSGPRQVGKTTLSKQLVPSFIYLNYDRNLRQTLAPNAPGHHDTDGSSRSGTGEGSQVYRNTH